ncbi:LysE family transporter [Comamonas flocculans]|uniref:Lysine transporter LysE n=1 Tax=Comamonas flocculans TaxID=2597701 RepID=A0A5B8RRX1_9BURK|nr:LysE family transporter [Comamonas flocculans]QEA12399.1 lysine transporter LysE [Comamonas flocculans]
MTLHLWLAYLVAAIAIALSPGPGAVLAMSHGLSWGVRAASVTILGLQAGLALILLVAGAGVGAVLLASGTAFTVVKVLGAAYLLWLGLHQWRAPVALAGGVDGAAARTSPVQAPLLSARQRFLRGLLTNATNPKGIVFMVAVLPQFMAPTRALVPQLLVLLATTITVDFIVMHGYALLAASLRGWLNSARAQRTQNRIAGAVLMAMGASLAFVGRVARA